jgi:hypothetical protein
MRNQESRSRNQEARRSDRGTKGRSSEQRCSNDKLLRHFKIYSQDLGYGNAGEQMELLNEVGRLLKGHSRAILAS